MDLSYLKPPEEGSIIVTSLSASTASSAIDLLAANTTQSPVVTFICNADFYITFSTDHATVTDPNMTATSGNGRTWGPLAAGTPHTFRIGTRNRYCKFISAEACYVRHRIED